MLLLYAGLASFSLRRESATFDETAHLPAGVSYLERFDFRMNPEHPPLAKAWAAVPIVLSGGPRVNDRGAAWERGDEWTFGFEMLNGPVESAERRDPADLLVPARSMMVVSGMLLGVAVFLWGRELWGDRGGLLALALFALSPTMLTHGRLVTTDLPAALGYVGVCHLAFRYWKRPSSARAAAVGAALGLSALVKFTTLALVAIVPVVLAIAWRTERRPWTNWLRGFALAALVAITTVWAGYGFRWAASPDPLYRLPWSAVEEHAEGSVGTRLAVALRDTHVVPEAFAYGIGYASTRAGARLAYLNGEESYVGWRSYFPVALALKTPPALFALAMWAAAFVWASRRDGPAWLFLVVPPVTYFAISVASNLNIGHRHLAPLEPFAFVACGALAPAVRSRTSRLALAATLVAYAGSAALATPGYLAYFNAFAGGKRGGPAHLVDSNADWGQDLPALRRWMEREGADRVALAYFGTADPRAYGIAYRKVRMVHDFRPHEGSAPPQPGEYLAISVTLLHGVYLDRDREFAESAVRRGTLARVAVDEWLALRDREVAANRDVPDLATWAVAQGRIDRDAADDALASTLWDLVRRIREGLVPVGYAGDSIRIYKLPEVMPPT